MKTKQFILNTILFASLFYLTLTIPIFIATYSQKWYESNYETLPTKDYITYQEYNTATNNLINYLTYQEPLIEIWSEHEKIHYKEVRTIFTKIFLLSIVALILLITLSKNKTEQIKKFAISNIIILIVISTLIMLNFQYFWNVIFHPILFNNPYWLMSPEQISYYLFPYTFFTNTIQFIIFVSIIENLIIYTLIKTRNSRNIKKN